MLTFPFDCVEHQGKQQISPYQQPKQEQTYSDVKPPTINSSFLQYGQLNENCENNLQSYSPSHRGRQLNTQQKPDQDGAIKKSQFNQSTRLKSEQLKIKNLKLNGRNVIERFVNKLKQKTYVYSENNFNQTAKKVLTEKYLELKNEDQSESEAFNILLITVWEISNYLFMLITLIIQPFQIAFQQQLYFFFSGLILLIIVIEMLIFVFQIPPCYKDNKKIKRNFIIEIVQFISCSILLFNNIDGQIQFFTLIIFQLSFFSKLKEKEYNLQNFFPYDLTIPLLVVDLFLLIHQCACIWHLLALFESNSWVMELGIQDSDNQTKYFYSFYWSTANLLGIGQSDVQIRTQNEQLLTSLVMIASQFTFIYIFYQISDTNLFQQQQNSNMKNLLKGVNQFLKARKVPYQIQHQVRSNIRNLKSNEFDQNQMLNVLSMLSQRVKEKLQNWMRAKALGNCGLLDKFSPNTKKYLIIQAEFINYKAHEVFKQANQNLYIIENGQIEVYEYGVCVKILKSGDYFGEYSFFSGKEVKTVYKTIKSTQLYIIDSQQFLTFIQQNKQDHEIYMFIKHSLIDGNYSIINQYCISCQAKSHLISDCPLLNYKPNIIRLIQEATNGSMDRKTYNRDQIINHREHNQVFIRFPLNFDALKLIRMKYEYFSDDNSSQLEEETEQYFSVSNQDWSSDQYYSSNLASDQNKDGTNISIRKQDLKKNVQKTQRGSDEIIKDEIQIIGPSTQSIILNTPQFQQRDLQFLQNSYGSEQQIKFSLSNDKIAKSVNSHKQDQIQQSLPSIDYNSGFSKGSRNQQQYSEKPKTESISNSYTPDRAIKNKTRIKEEDPDSLKSLSQRSPEDQLSVPIIKYTRNSNSSIPSKGIINISQKKFSTKLSSIKQENTDPRSLTNQRTDFNLFSRTKQRFPTCRVVDLSMYQNQDSSEQEFEVMYIFTIYYPLWNVNTVIRRVNNFIRNQIQQRLKSDIDWDPNSLEISQNINKNSFSQL